MPIIELLVIFREDERVAHTAVALAILTQTKSLARLLLVHVQKVCGRRGRTGSAIFRQECAHLNVVILATVNMREATRTEEAHQRLRVLVR